MVPHLIYEDYSCMDECKLGRSSWVLLVSIIKMCGMCNIPTTLLLSTPTHKFISKNLNTILILQSTPFILVIVVMTT